MEICSSLVTKPPYSCHGMDIPKNYFVSLLYVMRLPLRYYSVYTCIQKTILTYSKEDICVFQYFMIIPRIVTYLACFFTCTLVFVRSTVPVASRFAESFPETFSDFRYSKSIY